MIIACLVAGAAICAVLAIRATRLLSAALWLAGVSALVAIALYELGAQQVAVIELSVGAGLVTVLFVFAISIAGDDAMTARSPISRRLAVSLIGLFAALLGWMVLPLDAPESATAAEATFSTLLWEDRALDVLVQLVLIFCGVLSMLGILQDTHISARQETLEAAVPNERFSGNGHHSPEPLTDTPPVETVPEEVHA